MRKSKWVTLGLLLLGVTQVGCDDDCLAVQDFLTDTSNLTCKGSEDCVLVDAGCVSRARCGGKAALNKTAAASGEWKDLQAAARDCSDQCSVLACAPDSSCNDGFCGGRP